MILLDDYKNFNNINLYCQIFNMRCLFIYFAAWGCKNQTTIVSSQKKTKKVCKY